MKNILRENFFFQSDACSAILFQSSFSSHAISNGRKKNRKKEEGKIRKADAYNNAITREKDVSAARHVYFLESETPSTFHRKERKKNKNKKLVQGER